MNKIDNWIEIAKNHPLLSIIIFIAIIIIGLGAVTNSIDVVCSFIKNLLNKETPKIKLLPAKLEARNKSSNQKSFDAIFKILNISNQEITNIKSTVFTMGENTDIKSYNLETSANLSPYKIAKEVGIHTLNDLKWDYLVKYPYLILYIEFSYNKNSKEYGNIFFRKVTFANNYNEIHTDLHFVTEEEERILIKRLFNDSSKKINNNKTFKEELNRISNNFNG